MESSLARMTPQVGRGCGNAQALSRPYLAMLVAGQRLFEAQEAVYALFPSNGVWEVCHLPPWTDG